MPKNAENSVIRNILRSLFRRLMGLYFREVEMLGTPPDRSTEGRVFFANHNNGLVDPALILSLCDFSVAPLAKSTLWNIPLLKSLLDTAGAVPVIRRRDNPDKSASDTEAMFEKVSKHLADGGNILIFPEGTSHSEAHLVPLKSGAARILAKAKNEGAKGLTYQGIGLEFDAKDSFRSRALLTYGPVRTVDAHPEAGDALVSAIQTRMTQDLNDLVVTAGDWDDRLGIDLVAVMYENDARRDDAARKGDAKSMIQLQERALRVEHTRTWLEREGSDTLTALRSGVRGYREALVRAKTSDALVLGLEGPRAKKRAFFLAPLALAGVVLYYLPYQVPRWVVRATRASKDVVSTYKLGAGIVSFLVWAIALTATSLCLPIPLIAKLLALVLVLVCPFAALAYVDRRDDFASLGVVPDPATQRALQAERAALMKDLEDVRVKTVGLV